MRYQYHVITHALEGDLHTPISLYLKLRDLYPQSALLESSDFNSSKDSRSYIALSPIASVSVCQDQVIVSLPGGKQEVAPLQEGTLRQVVPDFMSLFDIDPSYGLFGYTAFDAVDYLEQVGIRQQRPVDNDAPDLYYILYQYILEVDPFHNTLVLRELVKEGETSQAAQVIAAISSRNFATYPFCPQGEVYSTQTDEEFLEKVRKGIAHCMRGDVFQVVLSRRYLQSFTGDDFMVYRALRQINPSPYLFYFDFGGFRIFGSSPETHCKIEKGEISIDPIAGTAFRTDDPEEDARRAAALEADPKENAEHVMLVDLARNDMSRNADHVRLKYYKQVHYYSHVIHLVSRVVGDIMPTASAFGAFLDTFPAGTLSGAPKVRAMQIINELEPHNRGIYGGAIGYIGFDNSFNHAITIRTFVSRNGRLEFQAGAGVVALSNPEREMQEVKSKLGALSKAIQILKTKEL